MKITRFSRAVVTTALGALSLSVSTGIASGPVEYELEALYSGFPGPDDDFGAALAIDDFYVAIGARRDDIDGLDSGAVYVYNRTGRNFLYAPFASDVGPGDLFGEYVAIDDRKLYATARFDEVDGTPFAGSVFVFDLTNNGRFLERLTAPTPTPGDAFGGSIAADNGLILVGAPTTRVDGVRAGAVYAYASSTFNYLTTLMPSDGTEDGRYGGNVKISADYVAVSSSRNDIGIGIGESGSVYLYDFTSGNLLHKLIPDDPQPGASFGASIAIRGDQIVIGAPFTADQGPLSGSVYIFDAITGNQIDKIIADDTDAFDWFGRDLAVDGNTLVIGAYPKELPGGGFGSVYIYDLSTNQMVDRVDNPVSGGTEERFGFVVAAGEGDILTANYNQVENGLETGVAFYIDAICPPDLNDDGSLDFFDISELINNQPDYNGDGVFNFFDISAFVTDYTMGCP